MNQNPTIPDKAARPNLPDHPPIVVAIADSAVALTIDHAGLHQAVARRFQPFVVERTPALHLRVAYTGQERAHSLLDQGMHFQKGRLHFDAPGYVGRIDERAGTGHLTLSSRQPVEDVDYFLRVGAALLLYQLGGLMFHAAGIVRAGRAYLFFGYSGSGKTTVSRLSQAQGDTVLNDDLLFLLPPVPDQPGQWTVHSTPFWNPTQVQPDRTGSAPLAALFRLVQAKQVFTSPMPAGQAVAEIMTSVPVLGLDPERSLGALARSRRLSQDLPVHHLHFLPDDSFWPVVLAAAGATVPQDTSP